MTTAELDVIVRIAGATLLLWAAFGPTGPSRHGRPYFIPLALCLCGFLAGNSPDPELQLSAPLGTVAALLAGFAAVFLWWYGLAVFDQSFRPRGAVLAGGVAWIAIASVDRGLFGDALAGKGLSWGLIGLGLAMIAHLTWRLVGDAADDLIDHRRRARFAVAVALSAQLLVDLTLDLVMGFDWGPQAFTIIQNGALLAFTGWLLSLDLTTGASARGSTLPTFVAPGSNGPAPDPVLVGRLRALMEVDRVYLNPDLTFEAFVRSMNASERAVRRLINQQLGYDHFRTFLNAYRVDEARRRLADPAHRNDKLIAIALDSGFASLPSFNRAFKDREGRVPSAFRATVAHSDAKRAEAGF